MGPPYNKNVITWYALQWRLQLTHNQKGITSNFNSCKYNYVALKNFNRLPYFRHSAYFHRRRRKRVKKTKQKV